MNMSILGVFYDRIFLCLVMTYFDTPIPRSAVVQRRVLSFAENAQGGKVDELAIASLR